MGCVACALARFTPFFRGKRRHAPKCSACRGAVLLATLGIFALAGVARGATVPAKKIQCANPSGDCHKVLVIPVKYPSICPDPGMPCDPGLVNNAICPVPGQPCDPNLWLHAPRENTTVLAAEIDGVNVFYDHWSFGSWQFDFDVLHNPESSDGWWPLPASYQSYYQSLMSGATFWQKGTAERAIVQDAIETIAGPASQAGLIPSLLTYSRFVVVDSNHDRYGQANYAVSYSVPVESIVGWVPFPHLFSGALVGVASGAADLRSVLAHELGHQTGLGWGYDLYGDCSIDETALPPFIEECNGRWDVMALDEGGPNHPTAFTKFAVGWIPDAPGFVTTLPPTGSTGFFSLAIGPDETVGGGDLRWVRIPTAAWTPGTSFEGFALECRRSIAGEVSLPEDGLLILKVRETDPGVALVGFKPARVIRTDPVAPSWENAALQPGEGYGDATEGVAIVFTGYDGTAADAPCLVEVTLSPLAARPDPAINPGFQGWADLWLDSEANGYGNFPANQPVDADGAPQGNGDPFKPGAWNRLYYRVRNVGNAVSPATTVHLRAQQPPYAACGAEGPSILDVQAPIPPLASGGVFVDYVGIHPDDPSMMLIRADIEPVPNETTVGNNHAERTLYSHGGSTLVLNGGGSAPLIISPAFSNACGEAFKAAVVPTELAALDGPPEPDPAWFWGVSGPGLLTVPDGATVMAPIEINAPAVAVPGTVLQTVFEMQAGSGSFSSTGAVEGDELETLLRLPLRLSVVEPSTLTAGLDANVQLVNGTITVSGLLTPAVQGSLLGVRYASPSGESIVHAVSSDASGAYLDRIAPAESGIWSVEVLWQGDDSRTEAVHGPLSFEILPPGSCLAPPDCEDANPCTEDLCDVRTHQCQYTVLPDGTTCEDGNACTLGNTCTSGACGTPVSCDDGIGCTSDSCDSSSGLCSNVPTPPGVVTGVVFVDSTGLAWTAGADAETWNTYRGSVPANGMSSRPAAYDHVCLEFADTFRDGPTLTTDIDTPPVGTAFYYLVTGASVCGEGSSGTAPDGLPRPMPSACP